MSALLPLGFGVIGAVVGGFIGAATVRGADDFGFAAGINGLFGCLVGAVVGCVTGTIILVLS